MGHILHVAQAAVNESEVALPEVAGHLAVSACASIQDKVQMHLAARETADRDDHFEVGSC